MGDKSASINLVKNKENFSDVFLKWALSIGKIVIVIVEIITLSAFIYRFSLDAKLETFHSSISQQQAIINSLKNNETEYRNLQQRLSYISNFSKQATSTENIFNNILSFVPLGITLTSFSVYANHVTIDSNATSAVALNDFITKLKNYPLATDISIDNIENKPNLSTISTTITVTLKQSSINYASNHQ